MLGSQPPGAARMRSPACPSKGPACTGQRCRQRNAVVTAGNCSEATGASCDDGPCLEGFHEIAKKFLDFTNQAIIYSSKISIISIHIIN